MSQPDLGTKRVCVSCGARFYDLNRAPAICPKCGTEQPALVPRLRRNSDSLSPVPASVAPIKKADEDIDIDSDDDTEDDDVMEDTADLDDDDDDISSDIDVSTDSDDHES
ncbi:TIGR02300 family protein [Acetobacter lambici]|uniref:TIGR02300 family protein n=1 Tax=Acetobacter lambici TaxID=1332824 RepID=A0ABT1F299_9PROT|nr:TIGR02300 family protein [Acetobacter lambici]MCP1243358.1 TIGR02300 family protein [Acetobacter lambici]MCP1259325.1 TIGR02300 family protein [Acetobacter lambici]NHO57586.1 TIGR02300 family protein [Acetobacter lambici]